MRVTSKRKKYMYGLDNGYGFIGMQYIVSYYSFMAIFLCGAKIYLWYKSILLYS
jgi:hypothetical protein